MEGQGTPLHYAAMINSIEATEYLLQNGASHDGKLETNWSIDMCPCEVRWEDRDYERAFAYLPLHTAACHGNLDVVQLLLEYGASVYVQCAQKFHPMWLDSRSRYSYTHVETGQPLLYSIIQKGQNRLAMTELIVRQPGTDIDIGDDDGRSALQLAVREPNNGKFIARLVQLGAADAFDPRYNHIARCLEATFWKTLWLFSKRTPTVMSISGRLWIVSSVT